MSMKKLMEMEEKVTIDSHCIVSESRHSREKEDAKANGTRKKMNDEEYEREKVEIIVHLEVLIELLQMNKEEQRWGFIITRKMN